MADTYGVTADDIANELPGAFPSGISVATRPSSRQVESLISDADLAVSIAVENASGMAPASSDRLARLARRVVIEKVKAQVLRIIYTSNDPAQVDAAAAPYELAAKDALASITALTTQATGTGEPPSRVITSSTTPERELLICDVDLGAGAGRRF